MKEVDFVKFYVDNFISLPLKTKTDIQLYRLVYEGVDTCTGWYSDEVLEKLFNTVTHRNPALKFVYKFCRDNKELFIKENF